MVAGARHEGDGGSQGLHHAHVEVPSVATVVLQIICKVADSQHAIVHTCCCIPQQIRHYLQMAGYSGAVVHTAPDR